MLTPLPDETKMKRLLKRSKMIFGSNADAAAPLIVTPAQKLVRVRREISTPSRVRMRMRSFETVTMCVVPTAPMVSGGIVVPLRNSALNVLDDSARHHEIGRENV